MTRSRPSHARVLTALVPILFAVAACGDGTPAAGKADGNMQAAAAGAPRCSSADTTPVGLAVLEYIGTASPRPQRFLGVIGSDSALPEDGFKALQAKGPTYFYNDDPKAQAQVKQKLASVGPYASMLVVFKGRVERDAGSTVVVTLGGHYIGGDHDGAVAPVREFTVRCDSTGWRLPSSVTKPAPDSAAGRAPERR